MKQKTTEYAASKQNRKGLSMKNLAKLFAAVAVSVIALALPVTSAHATEIKTTKNGIDCYLQTGGLPPLNLYPGNSRFYYCGSTAAHTPQPFTTVQSLVQTYPNSVGINFPAKPVYYYVFTDCLAYYKYFSATAPTQAQLQAYWTASQGKTGFSILSMAQSGVIVYEKVCGGTFPNSSPATANLKFVTAHESGHQFDFLYNNPSQGTFFTHLAEYDKAYMQAHDLKYTTDIVTYAYWLTFNVNSQNRGPGWAELFAEQFNVLTQGSPPQPPEPTQQLQSYWKCTNLYVTGYATLGYEPDHNWFVQNGGAAGALCPPN